MSAVMYVRVPPVAPRALEVMETETVERLVWEALFRDEHASYQTPDESLRSTDGGMTGGVLLRAKGPERTFLEGAYAVLPAGEDRDDLTRFLAALDEHGALLITKER